MDDPQRYKRIGLTKVDENSTPDTAEFFSISKDVICKTSSCSDASAVPYPEEITSAAPLLAEYMHTAHSVGLRILQILFQHLGVPGSAEVIASRHAFDQVAGDHVRMIRGPARRDAALPEIQTPAHTDFGSVTVLMNWLGGLQMWSEGSSSAVREAIPGKGAEAGKWLWVRPQANCAIINLGDAAGKFSNGVLRSGRHRVVPAPGEQGLWPRYSVVYFVRPNDECVLRTLEGSGIPARRNRGGEGAGDEDEDEEITAKEWIFRQAERLRNGKR
jgi:isopenicillin N synthase-like dioxygenase